MKIKVFASIILLILTNSTIALGQTTPIQSPHQEQESDKDFQDEEYNSILPIPNSYGWNSLSEWKEARAYLQNELKIYQLYEQQKQSHLVNALKSAIMPGWGHFAANSYTKGEVLLGVEILIVGSSIYYYTRAMDDYDKYKSANQIDEIYQYYTDANSAYKTSQIIMGLGSLVWLYTILDAVQVTEDYNRDLWKELQKQQSTVSFSIFPQRVGIEIKF
jgi:hypothetical protein